MKQLSIFKSIRIQGIGIAALLVLFLPSCKKLVEVDAPPTSTSADIVYGNDADATAVISNLYIRLSQNSLLNSTSLRSVALFSGLSADELVLFPSVTNSGLIAHYENNLNNSIVDLANYWTEAYNIIYITNAAIEGLTASTTITPAVRDQLLGEAKFIRAFYYFFLVNLYGDVPLNLTTDYAANAVRPRTDKQLVYQQVIADLKDAQALLTDDYKTATLGSTNERVKPNKFVATAMLARAYLYTHDYINAESEATKVIEYSSVYSLVSISDVFLKNSLETIWAIQPTNQPVSNVDEAWFFFPETGLPGMTVYLRGSLIEDMESGDLRRVTWIDSLITDEATFYCVRKYKNNIFGSVVTEYPIVMRLAEQYLIRAEARAYQNKLTGNNSAETDLNTIRTRAGLAGTTATGSREAMVEAILSERQVELVTEWGHRWLDLKRSGKADAILGPIKSPNWQTTDQLYLIPQLEIERNPAIRDHQNP